MPSDPALHLPARRFAAADWAWAAGMAAVAFGLYARTAGYTFIYLDDQVYVAANPYVQHGLSWPALKWAATATVVDNWHPLTLLVELVLSTLFGPSAATFHTANAVLHGTTTGLLFAFCRTATGQTGAAAAVAALWGFHPLRVESVAWIAELKDGLSGLFWVASLLAYAAYARRRTAGRYCAVAGLFVAALLSKPSAVTLPVVLLLLDVWPLGTSLPGYHWWRNRLLEKLPLVGLAAAAGAVRIATQAAPAGLLAMPARVRFGNAVLSVVAYLRQTVWPTGLGLFYPHPWLLGHAIPTGPVIVATVALAAVTVAAVVLVRQLPYVTVGWLWFGVTLLPMLGLLQAGDQARGDRYTYLPAMGLTIAVVYAVADWAASAPVRRSIAAALGVVASAALAIATSRLVPTWQSAWTVWPRADAVIPDNYFAKAFRAALAVHDGDLPAAERFARAAVGIVPDRVSDGRLALAEVLDAEGRPADAAREYAAALRVAPADPDLRYKAGLFYDHQHDGPAARDQFAAAAKLDPAWVAPRLALARSFAGDGRAAAAADAYRAVLRLDPGNGPAGHELATLARAASRPSAATGSARRPPQSPEPLR